MAVKIRLARCGKKNYALYNIVVADSRSPRDGRFIERIGLYNPNTNPAFIELNGEKALKWLNVGAQPTDTCRRILSHEGVLLKKHLQGGIKKGALTEEQADQKWNAWMAERDAKIEQKKQSISKSASQAKEESVKAESKVNAERAEAIELRKKEEAARLAAEAQKAAAEEAPVEETLVETVVEEIPVEETPEVVAESEPTTEADQQ